MQKWLYSISPFLSPLTRLATPIFDHPPPKKFYQLLIFVIMYQHAKNQFIPSFHSSDTVNFRVPPPDWPYPFLTLLIFDHGHTHFWVKLYQHAKKPACSISSLLRYSTFYSPETRLAMLIFNHAPLKTFQSTFIFCKFVSTNKKWGCFIDLLWRNAWFKNPVIWMAESILAYISGTKFFPNRSFVKEHSK